MNHGPERDTQFPRGNALVIGDPSSIFPARFAEFFKQRGFRASIVTRSWGGGKETGGFQVLQSAQLNSVSATNRMPALEQALRRAEAAARHSEADRAQAALAGTGIDWCPSFVEGLLNGASLPPFVDTLRPAVILGQEAFANGLATALCRTAPRILMPWGGDIYYFAHMNSVSFEMVRRALTSVDLVLSGGQAGTRYLVNQYGVAPDHIYTFSWGIDTSLFRRASPGEREAFCLREGIPADAKIIVNARKFHPRWGSDLALEAFRTIVREEPQAYCFMVAGTLTETFSAAAREQVRAEGLDHRIRIFDRHVPDARIRELFSVADVFTSLVRTTDMRGSTILECSACGATPILSEVEEYRDMAATGLRALFVDVGNPQTILDALRACLSNEALRAEMARANRVFILRHEDRRKTLDAMFTAIEQRIAAWQPATTKTPAQPIKVIREILRPYRSVFEPSWFDRVSARAERRLESVKSKLRALRRLCD
jgi:glycosyltransferase involved in cell wall biosynthesis